MATRFLGKSGIAVPPLAFGGNVFGWTVGAEQSFSLLDELMDKGLNFIDTADVYSRWASGNQGGESETILGQWLARRGRREDVIIATKVGMDMGEGRKGLSARYIGEAVDASLKRLKTDYIDLYQAHTDDEETPLEETLGAFARLVEQGKVRAIGASNYSAARLAEALQVSQTQGLPRYETMQPHYNLVERPKFEGDLEKVCVEKGLGVITYWSLASGFLSGKYRSKEDLKNSQRGSAVEKYLDAWGMRVLDALDEVAKETAANPAQVALAWLIARPSVTAPIASATTSAQLEDLVRATTLVLEPSAIERLDRASAP